MKKLLSVAAVDLADNEGGKNIEIIFNQYGPNYQANPNLKYYSYVKADKPQAGDTVVINYKFKADKDLPVILLGLVDDSPKANYWTNLLDPSTVVLAENIKAGEIYEGTIETVLATSAAGAFSVYLQYDSDDSVKLGYEKLSDSSKLELIDVEGVDTTDAAAELAAAASAAGVEVSAEPTGPRTFDVNITDVAKMFDLAVNASNGTIWNYQFICSITDLFDFDNLPKAGDTINISFKGSTDYTIEAPVYMTIVENTAAVGWWKDLVATDESKFHVFAEQGTIVAGEQFTAQASFTLSESATEGLSIQMYYDNYEGAKSSTWLFARD